MYVYMRLRNVSELSVKNSYKHSEMSFTLFFQLVFFIRIYLLFKLTSYLARQREEKSKRNNTKLLIVALWLCLW